MTPAAYQFRLPGREWTICTEHVARDQASHASREGRADG